MSIASFTHPEYDAMVLLWEKYRLTAEGGKYFIDKYLETSSSRELATDFVARKKMTYCPAYSKAALMDVKNSIYQRLIDVERIGGPQTYRDAIIGKMSGVDYQGNTMNGFIGRFILPELLAMAKVGVYIDKQQVESNTMLINAKGIRPYVYRYLAEDIRSWSYDNFGNLVSVLLRDYEYKVDKETGLVVDIVEKFRLLQLTETGVEASIYDKDGKEQERYLLNITKIPFVIFTLSDSLLTDIADHQIALLNLASSDMSYALKANFPFYTEQFDPRTDGGYLKPLTGDGVGENPNAVASKEVKVGVTHGRRYPLGSERPGFINPSAEPLKASMEKQESIKAEIRQLINLALTNLTPQRATAESKEKDNDGLKAGLSYIGLELEYGERYIADVWAMYEGGEAAQVNYPRQYDLRSEEERLEEANTLDELLSKIPSLTYQKEIAKKMATIVLGSSIDDKTLKSIHKEIDGSTVIVTNPDIVKQDHEAGFVSTETASALRGYPKGEVEQAKKDHAERAARIALAQSEAGARGVSDLSANKDEGKEEKTASQSADTQEDSASATRGDAD